MILNKCFMKYFSLSLEQKKIQKKENSKTKRYLKKKVVLKNIKRLE